LLKRGIIGKHYKVSAKIADAKKALDRAAILLTTAQVVLRDSPLFGD